MTVLDASNQQTSRELWDAVVIGAGPAGAISSYLLAKSGVRTLLVEAKAFPRGKVCGGCLNARGIAALESISLGETLKECQPTVVDCLKIVHRNRSAELSLPAGLSVSRETLDAALVEASIAAGVTFMPETSCRVLSDLDNDLRVLRLSSHTGETTQVSARVVLACDGLGHPSLVNLPEVASTVAAGSRIGLGAIVEDSEASQAFATNTIYMAVAEQGYVGLAHAERGRVSIASAVDPKALAAADSPASLLRQMLRSAGLDYPTIDDSLPLRGTPPITQQAGQVASHRLFLLGDAAGYVEPFTGEGMAAAIEGAMSVAPLANQAVANWNEHLAAAWQETYHRTIRSRQQACKAIAWLVRHPRLLQWSIGCLSYQPFVGNKVARWVGSMRTPQGKSC
ncbi:NAD(P)/FAD-dependent oxidoreductase [Aeoliella mucimassa]|uniref:FAD-binding domain-containing protein n=1 Tax=Aeoliella mucimassa TaxID=2527972 RepID=A0A518ALV2_9BACT|nr:NAD(P)/FAD-dependent oxidoreductase [Aeoliella mucimassa]QDU55705.1 hypothetical protein Pan181_18990 [Aeoliella mucimassa]